MLKTPQIHTINLTEEQYKNLSYDKLIEILKPTILNEVTVVKSHQVIFVKIEGYLDHYGYTALVFKNNRHIYYADELELHNKYYIKDVSDEEKYKILKEKYVEKLNNKLFTNDELLEEVKSYEEKERKLYFLRNYYIMRFDYLTIFAISKKDKGIFEEKKKDYPYYNHVSFCYVKDQTIIDTQEKYLIHIVKSFSKIINSNDVFRTMISTELANHEACITCSYSDALEALGLKFEDLTEEKQRIVLEELNRQIDNYHL